MKKHKGELEIDEDIELERTNWVVQRIAWVLMALVVLAALLGFTGSGGIKGITQFTAGSQADGLELAYDRFLRRHNPSEIQVTLYPMRDASFQELHFNKDFQEKLHVEQVIPEPAEVYSHAQGITYSFKGTDSPSTIIFYIKPKHIGSLDLHITGSWPKVAFSQFVYP
jgi:hypothetical protein